MAKIASCFKRLRSALLPTDRCREASGHPRRAITLPVYTVGLLLDHLSEALDRRRLRAMERICLEQAQLCGLPESRAALEEMVRNYRAAIDGAG
jgi:hypothetical protein